MMLPLEQDPLARRLLELGFELKDYKLTQSPYDRNVVGRTIQKGFAQITYNYFENDPRILVIALYELSHHKAGLANPFFEAISLIDLCAKEDLGIERIECAPKAIASKIEKGLTPYKIGEFCKKYMGATLAIRPPAFRYYYLNLKDYKGLIRRNNNSK